jgi:hypothetical protein
MATGDQADCTNRLLLLLPPWFVQGGSSVLSAVLQGSAYVLSFCFSLIEFSRLQTRIGTATGGWLDLIAYDFFGYTIQRALGQADASFRKTIEENILPAAGSRQALISSLISLTGREPVIYDPWNPGSVGGYGIGNLAYGVAGQYGSYVLPGEFFITAFRPNDGFHTATDAQIYARIAGLIPAGSRAWTALSN